tara:strand:+ start:192 stop:761 length:570 start_codon:yes stop_codon:yes gene_type:complete
MAINISIGQKEPPITVTVKTHKVEETIQLQARKSLNGDIMIYDHTDIDIVVIPGKKKILTFAKEYYGDHVYEAQNRLFKFLMKRGIIDYDSVQGGNVFSSMEATIQESKQYNEVQHALLAVSRFLEEERPLLEFEKAFDDAEEGRLNEPPPGEYTEWDPDTYHSEKKGSINRGQMPFGMSTAAVYRLEE